MKPIYVAAIQRAAQKVTPMAVAPLRFTNTGETEATVAFNDVQGNGTQLQYRKSEKKAFSEWDLSAVTLHPGEYMEVVGDTTAATKFIGRFVMTGTIAASGSVMSIVYGESITVEQNLIMPYNKLSFLQGSPDALFYNCKSLITAPELPATTLVANCYSYLFSYCKNMTAAPELPATTLASGCYEYMFSSTALTAAPELRATTLAPNCYKGMFSDCSRLAAAPELPATTLASGCYYSMFSSTALTAAPELPATTLASGCYQSMFFLCSGLNEVIVGFNAWGNNSETDNWLNGVAAAGIFKCPAGLNTTTRDESHVPEGWTVKNE